MKNTSPEELIKQLSDAFLPGLTILKNKLSTKVGFEPEFWQIVGPLTRVTPTKNSKEDLKTALKVPDAALSKVKTIALDLMVASDWQGALDVCLLLCALDTKNYEYWLMLGSCRYQLKLYEEALSAYVAALTYNPYEIRAYIWQAYTFKMMGLPTKSKQVLKIALKFIEDFPDNTSAYKEEILILLDEFKTADPSS